MPNDQRSNGRLSFTLAQSFCSLVLVALSLAVFGWLGLIIGPLLLGIVVVVRSGESQFKALLVVVFVAAVLALSILPAFHSARECGRRAACDNNMSQIGRALRDYVDHHGKLPLVQQANASGKPPLSWRVRLLPTLDEQSLYERYHQDEPWDSPGNGKLAKPTLFLYRCPADCKSYEKGITR